MLDKIRKIRDESNNEKLATEQEYKNDDEVKDIEIEFQNVVSDIESDDDKIDDIPMDTNGDKECYNRNKRRQNNNQKEKQKQKRADNGLVDVVRGKYKGECEAIILKRTPCKVRLKLKNGVMVMVLKTSIVPHSINIAKDVWKNGTLVDIVKGKYKNENNIPIVKSTEKMIRVKLNNGELKYVRKTSVLVKE